MRKLLAGVCLAVALTGVACGEKTGGAEDANALAAAADNAIEAGSARTTMEMTMDVGRREVSAEGEGEIDFAEDIGSLTMTMSGAGLPEGVEMDMVMDGQYRYMKLPAQLGGDGGWMRIDLGDTPAFAAGSQFNQDLSQYLDFLRGASEGDIEEAGTEEIRGVPTTHYKATLSFDRIIDQAPDQESADELRTEFDSLGGDEGSIPAEVWIDHDGYPRRVKVTMSVDVGGEAVETRMSFDLFDYGVEVDVEPPEDFEEIALPAG